MGIETLEILELDGWTAAHVRVTENLGTPRGEVSDGWELGCDSCDFFATNLSRQDVDDELAEHVHYWSPRSIEKADAILADHAAGLHAAEDDESVGCLYPGCEDAFWLFARRQEQEA